MNEAVFLLAPALIALVGTEIVHQVTLRVDPDAVGLSSGIKLTCQVVFGVAAAIGMSIFS